MKKLQDIFEKYNVHPRIYTKETPIPYIKMCDIAIPRYGCIDWTYDIYEDYDIDDYGLLDELQPFIDNKEIMVLGCEECRWCGDW